jgi:hypothetical protein
MDQPSVAPTAYALSHKRDMVPLIQCGEAMPR